MSNSDKSKTLCLFNFKKFSYIACSHYACVNMRHDQISVMSSMTALILQKKLPYDCVFNIMKYYAARNTLQLKLMDYCDSGFYDGTYALTRSLCVDNSLNMFCACSGGHTEIINLFIMGDYDMDLAIAGASQYGHDRLVRSLKRRGGNKKHKLLKLH